MRNYGSCWTESMGFTALPTCQACMHLTERGVLKSCDLGLGTASLPMVLVFLHSTLGNGEDAEELREQDRQRLWDKGGGEKLEEKWVGVFERERVKDSKEEGWTYCDVKPCWQLTKWGEKGGGLSKRYICFSSGMGKYPDHEDYPGIPRMASGLRLGSQCPVSSIPTYLLLP